MKIKINCLYYMISVPTVILLWDLYNYYSMLSIIYNSYWYASLSLYYFKLLKHYICGERYEPITNIQLTQSFEDWEIIDIV